MSPQEAFDRRPQPTTVLVANCPATNEQTTPFQTRHRWSSCSSGSSMFCCFKGIKPGWLRHCKRRPVETACLIRDDGQVGSPSVSHSEDWPNGPHSTKTSLKCAKHSVLFTSEQRVCGSPDDLGGQLSQPLEQAPRLAHIHILLRVVVPIL
jgi:hypothetical protein